MRNFNRQNESLRQELVRVKAQSEAKDAQIAKLEDDLKMKDLEAEEYIIKNRRGLR